MIHEIISKINYEISIFTYMLLPEEYYLKEEQERIHKASRKWQNHGADRTRYRRTEYVRNFYHKCPLMNFKAELIF